MVTKKLISRMFSVVLVVMFLLTGILPMQTATAAASNTAELPADLSVEADLSVDNWTQIKTLLPAPAGALMAEPSSLAGELVSPVGLLNPDGTLHLDGSTSGSLDLSGWDVQIDPERGPVFSSPESVEPSLLSGITPGSWEDLGGGGGGAVNDYIFAIAVSGSDVYVGGWFTDVDNIPEADYVAKWDGANWSALGSNGAGAGSINGGAVHAITVSGSDVYVGGIFFNVNNNGTPLPAADNLAKWNGTNWSAFGNNGSGNGSLNSAVYAIGVSGSDVYVGGQFTNVNNNGTPLPAADFIAKWNGTIWSALGVGVGGDGSLNASVYALAVSGSNVYAGGYFINVNNNGTPLPAADYIAKWDGTDWSALGSNGASNGSLNTAVSAIVISGSDVYVGGYFTNVNDNGTPLPAADYIAKWNGTNWFALGSNGAGNGSLSAQVNGIVVSGLDLYVGGQFANVNNNGIPLPAADYIAKWNGSNWSAVGSNGTGDGSLNNAVVGLGVSGSNVYIGGYFDNVNNNGSSLSQAVFTAKWDGSNWSAMGAAQGSIIRSVNVVTVSGTDVYVGGYFNNVSNGGTAILAADNIAKWDGADWSALGSNGAGNGAIGGTVLCIAVSGTDVYVGGQLFAANLPEGVNIAKWDGTNWSALGGNGAGGGSLNNQVNAIAVSGSNVYAGGYFTDVNNNGTTFLAADYIAMWNGTDWSALGSDGAGNGSLNSAVNAIAVSGSNVYAGGWFSNVNNNGAPLPTADYIAMWNGANWSALGSDGAGNGSLNSRVYAVAVSGANIYVGGQFDNVRNGATVLNAADYIAKWNGTDWSALGSNGSGEGSLNNKVLAIAVNGSNVYAGGDFYDVNDSGTTNLAADYVAKWNGSTWSSLGSDGAGNGSVGAPTIPYVNAVGTNGPDVYVGGNFFNVNNNGIVLPYADYVAAYVLSVTPPTVVMSSLASDPTSTSPIPVIVQFSETVTGFLAGDITPGNGRVSNFVAVDGDTYTFNLIPSGQGLVTANIAAGMAIDLADNGNTIATQFSRTYSGTYTLFLPLILR